MYISVLFFMGKRKNSTIQFHLEEISLFHIFKLRKTANACLCLHDFPVIGVLPDTLSFYHFTTDVCMENNCNAAVLTTTDPGITHTHTS